MVVIESVVETVALVVVVTYATGVVVIVVVVRCVVVGCVVLELGQPISSELSLHS